jgi:cystathionine beta-synthase
MSAHLKTVRASAPVKELMPLFAENYVPVVVDNDHFLGLITRIDLINELRKNPQ